MNTFAHLTRKSCAVVGLLLALALHSSLVLAVTTPETAETADQKDAAAIINGTDAPVGMYPWMSALIGKSSKSTANSRRQFCGGSLIAPQWVLTAAHCVKGEQASTFQVLVGRENLDSDSGGQLLDVSEIIMHPRYDSVLYSNDVALIRLAAPASATPVPLPAVNTVGTLNSMLGTALGWGTNNGVKKPACKVTFPQTTPTNASDYYCWVVVYSRQGIVTQLQTTQLSVLANDVCYSQYASLLQQHGYSVPSTYSPDKPLLAGDLCMLDLTHKTSVCYGDSGGPLLAQVAGQTVLAGIASVVMQSDCQGEHGLQLFVEVAQFLDFINQTMLSNKALNFSQLCPRSPSLSVDVQPSIAGTAKATATWKAADSAVGYTLLYAPVPRQSASVGRLDLASSTTEFSITLPAGAHYMVAVQARGRDCDGSVSKPVEVRVP